MGEEKMSERRRAMMRLGLGIRKQVANGRDLLNEVLPEAENAMRYVIDRDLRRAGLCVFDLPESAIWISRSADNWSLCGFPVLSPSHHLAASLMATTIPPEHVPKVAIPWHTFAISIPRGILLDNDVEHLIVHQRYGHEDGPAFAYLVQFEGSGRVFAWGADSFAELPSASNPASSRPGNEDFDRFRLLLGRLVLGLCIELDQPKYREQIALGPRHRSVRRESDEPKAWTFQLTRHVKVDCRPWVTTYLSGKEGTSPSVQTLVRGHHKMQAHGPGGTLRKWIHVEPYWRGPEDAPIAVRSHVLTPDLPRSSPPPPP